MCVSPFKQPVFFFVHHKWCVSVMYTSVLWVEQGYSDKQWFSGVWKDPAGPSVINRLTFLLLVIDLLSSSSNSPRCIICSMSSISLKEGRLMAKQNIEDELNN